MIIFNISLSSLVKEDCLSQAQAPTRDSSIQVHNCTIVQTPSILANSLCNCAIVLEHTCVQLLLNTHICIIVHEYTLYTAFQDST